ncbi:unnamed protein product [Rhizoctonia solani]|uniref:Uncharacterized protein n=1 Tax=Rhizoctonia solani TaxID=456999 RepID=A0A8H3GW75_9AGAM|nr:unnamed protein product [Rhizoctonia solani]
MDTSEEIQASEHTPPLFVPEFSDASDTENQVFVEQALQLLIHTLSPYMDDQHRILDTSYIGTMQNQLYEILDERLSLVNSWISINIAHFPLDNQDIQILTKKLESASLSMRATLRLCPSGCSNCQLLCLRTYNHPGYHSCGTNHWCWSSCEVLKEHGQDEPCGLPAGHRDRHIFTDATCNITSAKRHAI